MTDPVAAFLNSQGADAARAALQRCCAATRWVDGMLAALPFADDATLFATAERLWWQLPPADWREAFAAHPRIGERPSERHGATRAWSEQEQAGVRGADDDTRRALAEGNRAYEERFGHVFLICATGLTATAMLAALQRRLQHSPDDELCIAAAEQAKITRLRLEKLVQP